MPVALPLVAIERASGSESEICLSSLFIISALIALSRTISSLSFSGLWDLSCWGDFRRWPPNPVAVEQLQVFVKPLATPPLPAEALSFPSPQHMAPDLLLHPVF